MCPWAKLFSLLTKAWGAALTKITCWKQWVSVSPTQPGALPSLLTWSTLHPCWAGVSHLWWKNGLVCLSFGHDKSWGSSPRQGRCFWTTWWNTPPCCAKYPASTGWVTCAFPPALLLHPAYLEPSSTSWNFNHISFLNTSLSHITAQQKSLESTEDEFYSSTSIYLRRSLKKN